MVRRSFARIVAALALGLGLTLGLVWLLNSPARGLAAPPEVVAESRAPDAVHTVCPAGPPTCDHAVIQEAVDAAGEGDLIKVAAGVYAGVNDYGGLAQVVYISKSLSLQGGYTTTNWAASNPISHPTTLDAQGQGRVIVITGSITVSIAGVRITGGDTAGLPSSGWGGRNGAGLLIGQAAVTVDQCSIFGNSTAAVAKGAGVYVTSGHGLVFSRNDVYSNTVSGDYGFGAGLYVEQSDRLVIISNTITGNRGLTGPLGAGAGGGGVSIGPGTGVLLSHNVISDNHVAGAYGGLAIWADKVTLSDNIVADNSAGYFAGGLGIDDSEMVTVSSNLIVGNRASGLEAREGAGVIVFRSSQVTLTNNVVADNRLITGGVGSGVYVEGSQCNLVHNTIARNGGGDGSGIHVANWDSAGSTVSLTNTILVSQTVGITVSAGSTAAMEATLWGSGAWANAVDWGGAGTILTGTVNVWGDPVFVDPAAGDYHIGPGSAAIDAGVEAGVPEDMDGEFRPAGSGYDIGADEVQALVRYVATDGADSGDCSTPAGRCLTVQYAVDQAWEGDEVRVASGTYTGVNGCGGLAQVVYISKSLSLRGGYTTTNWATANPISYPTALDAERQGRVLVISGTITVAVEGLRITGGEAGGLGGGLSPGDVGGGVYVVTAAATISNCEIVDNSVQSSGSAAGGGLYLLGSGATLSGNKIRGNRVSGPYSSGGGLSLWGSPAVLDGNTVTDNRAQDGDGGGISMGESAAELRGNTIFSNTAGYGGGIHLYFSAATLSGNTVISNTATGYGGGLLLYHSDATVDGNDIVSNRADDYGGGAAIGYSEAVLSRNTVISNTSHTDGGGLYLWESSSTLVNNVVAENRAASGGSGLLVMGGEPQLSHNTVARNGGADGSGIHVTGGYDSQAVVVMTNTILVSHTVGISVSAGSTATMEATLWGAGHWDNGVDWGGAGTILTGTVNVWGDPVFVDPAAGDYHIGPGSAAIDAGVDAGVAVDMDRESRPVGGGYDIGADEFAAGPTCLYLPLILR